MSKDTGDLSYAPEVAFDVLQATKDAIETLREGADMDRVNAVGEKLSALLEGERLDRRHCYLALCAVAANMLADIEKPAARSGMASALGAVSLFMSVHVAPPAEVGRRYDA